MTFPFNTGRRPLKMLNWQKSKKTKLKSHWFLNLWKLEKKKFFFFFFFLNGQIVGYCTCGHNYYVHIIVVGDSKLPWKHPVWLKRYKTVISYVFVCVRLSIRLSACIIMATIGRIAVKFGTGGLLWRCQENPNLVKIRKNIWHFKSMSEYVLLLVTIKLP